MSYNQPPNYGTPPPPGGYGGGQPPYGGGPYGGAPYGGPSPASGDPGTLDLPWYGIGFVPALKRGFQKYARFDGRASRSEYWFFTLGLFAVYVVLYIPMFIGVAADVPALTILFAIVLIALALAAIVPTLALAVRRLHDGGFSGWMYLLAFVPFVGGIIVLVLMCLPSKPEGARFDRGATGWGGPAGGQQYGGQQYGGQQYGGQQYGGPYGG